MPFPRLTQFRRIGCRIGRCRPHQRSRSHLRKLRVVRQPSSIDAIELNPVANNVRAHQPAAVIPREFVGLNGLLRPQPARPAAITAAFAKNAIPRGRRTNVNAQPGDRILEPNQTARGIFHFISELEIFKAETVRVYPGVEVNAHRIRRSIVDVAEVLGRTGRSIGAKIVVLEEIETIERPRAASHVPVHAFIGVELPVGFAERCIQPIKGISKRLTRRKVLLRAFRVSEPEHLTLDDRSSRIGAEQFALKGRWRGTRQIRRTLVAAEHSKRPSVDLVAARPGNNVNRP